VDGTGDVPPGEEHDRLLLRAILAEGAGTAVSGPDTWTLLAGRLEAPDDVDAVGELARTALPMLAGRWRAQGRPVDRLPLVLGLRRRMVVRNRLVLAGARTALARLDAAGIPALPLKSSALLGRVLPDAGLRPIADADLWVRPRDHAAALRLLATGRPTADRADRTPDRAPGRATRDPHGGMLRDALGRELDVHRLPSELFARRGTDDTAAEALFARAWDGRVDGRPVLSDAIQRAFVNVLFSHAPGEARAAFALVELDAVLRHPDVTGATLEALVTAAVEDRTTVVLVEHLDGLGRGASEPLDRLLEDHLAPALTADDRRLRDWLARSHRPERPAEGDADARTDGRTDVAARRRLRQLALARGTVPDRPVTVARLLVRAELQDARRDPWGALTAPLRRRARQRIGGIVRRAVLDRDPMTSAMAGRRR